MTRGRAWIHRALATFLDWIARGVPSERRGRWLEEWRSETWHAFDSGNAGAWTAVAFAWGALRDATDVRRRARRARGPGFMDTTRQDLRLALRSLRARPGFTALVVAILALGIGANTAVFSLAREALVAALPYPDAEQLVRIWERRPEQGRERNVASLPDYVDWREQSSSFEAMTTYRGRTRNFTTDGRPRRLLGAEATRGFFRVFGVQPALGRSFTPEEWSERGVPALILSHRLWRESYGEDPEIIGRSVSVDLTRHTVVVVMPPEFDYPYEAEFWFPRTDDPSTAGRGSHGFNVLGRLKAGVGIRLAREDLDAIAHRLEAEHPDTNRGHYTAVYELRDEILSDTGPVLLLLLGAVGVILLMACVNVANMALVRSAGRGPPPWPMMFASRSSPCSWPRSPASSSAWLQRSRPPGSMWPAGSGTAPGPPGSGARPVGGRAASSSPRSRWRWSCWPARGFSPGTWPRFSPPISDSRPRTASWRT